MRVSLVFILLAGAWPAPGCSCRSYEPFRACDIYSQVAIVFRGRVIDDNREGSSDFGYLYRFRVIENFKGLPPGTQELFIDPGSMSSCRADFSADSDYLIFVERAEAEPATFHIRMRKRPIPSAWKSLGKLRVLRVGQCSPLRAVTANDPDLVYLRSPARDDPRATGSIVGQAVQNPDWPYTFADFVPVRDAMLTATPAGGQPRQVKTLPDGTFSLEALRPGRYAVAMRSPVLGAGRLPSGEVDVPAGGCAVVRASFETKASISGVVLNAAGRPAPEVTMALGELGDKGTVRGIPRTRATTDAAGRFTINQVPVGRIVLAANLNGAPTREMPFDPVYLLGKGAAPRVLTVAPAEQIRGVTLRLPKSLPFGDLWVEVLWPDGSAARGGARATADWIDARADFQSAPKAGNRVKLRLALGREYQVQADWFDGDRDNSKFVDGEVRSIDFKRDGQVVQIRLNEPRPH